MALRLARDDRLARLAAAGDSRAFAVIYERYHQPIYRYCQSILQDPDDAADALQNAMLKAMRSLEGSDREIALKPWLFRIAHNEAISLVRRRRTTAPLEDGEGPASHSADEDASTRERLSQLVEDLRELPDRQRGALLMRELAGLGFQEIGDVFGVSPAAAKQTVYEARTALHEYVEGRDMRCEDARQSLSAGDRRMLRGRKLSAHLRDCASCRDFQAVMRTRSRDVAAIAPPISAAASAAILKGILGAGAGGGGGGGIVAWITGSGAKALLGPQAAKSVLAAALVTASAGALGVVSALNPPDTPSSAGPASGSAVALRPTADTSPAPGAGVADPSAGRQRATSGTLGGHSRRGSGSSGSRTQAPSGGGSHAETIALTVGQTAPAAPSGPQTAPSSTGPALPESPAQAPQVVALPPLADASIAPALPSLPAAPTVSAEAPLLSLSQPLAVPGP